MRSPFSSSTKVRVHHLLLPLLVAGLFAVGVAMPAPVEASPIVPVATEQALRQQPVPDTGGAGDGSPRAFAENVRNISSVQDACNYLSFCRWGSISSIPAPTVGFTSLNQIAGVITGGLAQIVFLVASMIAFVLGFVLMFAISLDFITQASFAVDSLFARLGTGLLGMTGESGVRDSLGVVSLIILIVLGVAAWNIVRPGRGAMTGRLNGSVRSVVIALAAVIGMGIMAHQGARNHPELAGPGAELSTVGAASNGGESLYDGPELAVSTDPNNWAPLSPGWIISQANSVVKTVSGAAVSVFTDVGNAVKNTVRSSDGAAECDRYTGAMAAAFRQTAVAQNVLRGNEEVLIAYDRLIQQIYFRNYQLSAFGSSSGASGAWCRVADNLAGRPAGEQFMLLRASGVASEAVGSGGLGLVGGDPSAVVVDSSGDRRVSVGVGGGAYVAGDGSWVGDPAQTIGYAQNFIGPIYSDASGVTKSTMYWAACRWPAPGEGSTSGVVLNPEWAQVQRYDNDDPLTVENCLEVIKNEDGGGFAPTDEPFEEGGISNPLNPFTGGVIGSAVTAVGANDSVEGSPNGLPFNYHDTEGSLIGTVVGFGGSNIQTKFSQALDPSGTGDRGNSPALSYYLTRQGSDTGSALVLALITLALVYLVTRYFGPLVVGGMLLQFLAVGVLIFLVLLVIFLIMPMQRARDVGKAMVRTVVTSMLASTLLAVLFGLTFSLCVLFTGLLDNPGGGKFAQALLLGAGSVAAFWVMRQLIGMLFGNGINTIRGGISSTVGWGTSPLTGNRGLGNGTVNPISRDFWMPPQRPRRFRRNVETDGTAGAGPTGGGPADQNLRKNNGGPRPTSGTGGQPGGNGAPSPVTPTGTGGTSATGAASGTRPGGVPAATGTVVGAAAGTAGAAGVGNWGVLIPRRGGSNGTPGYRWLGTRDPNQPAEPGFWDRRRANHPRWWHERQDAAGSAAAPRLNGSPDAHVGDRAGQRPTAPETFAVGGPPLVPSSARHMPPAAQEAARRNLDVLLDNLVPDGPGFREVSQGGVLLPTSADVDRFREAPGVAYRPEARLASEDQVRDMFGAYNLQAMREDIDPTAGMDPVTRAASVAWMLNADTGLYLPDHLMPGAANAHLIAEEMDGLSPEQLMDLQGSTLSPQAFRDHMFAPSSMDPFTEEDLIQMRMSVLQSALMDRPWTEDAPEGVPQGLWDTWSGVREYHDQVEQGLHPGVDPGDLSTWDADHRARMDDLMVQARETYPLLSGDAGVAQGDFARATFVDVLGQVRPRPVSGSGYRDEPVLDDRRWTPPPSDGGYRPYSEGYRASDADDVRDSVDEAYRRRYEARQGWERPD